MSAISFQQWTFSFSFLLVTATQRSPIVDQLFLNNRISSTLFWRHQYLIKQSTCWTVKTQSRKCMSHAVFHPSLPSASTAGGGWSSWGRRVGDCRECSTPRWRSLSGGVSPPCRKLLSWVCGWLHTSYPGQLKSVGRTEWTPASLSDLSCWRHSPWPRDPRLQEWRWNMFSMSAGGTSGQDEQHLLHQMLW